MVHESQRLPINNIVPHMGVADNRNEELAAILEEETGARRTFECPGLNIHHFDEEIDLDKSMCYRLNKKLIDYLESVGIKIKRKIGEGGVADVFLVHLDNDLHSTDAALLLQSNIEGGIDYNLEYLQESLENIEDAKKYPHIFPIVYDHFKIGIPYSDDHTYQRLSTDFQYRTIQVIELIDMRLDDYIVELVKEYGTGAYDVAKDIAG